MSEKRGEIVNKHIILLVKTILAALIILFCASSVSAVCSDCGEGLLNLCDEEECLGLGDCAFTPLLVGGNCVEVSVPADCNGDGICDSGETFENCPNDCADLSSDSKNILEWRMFGRNLDNNRYTPMPGPSDLSLSVDVFSGGKSMEFASPIVSNGFVYMAIGDTVYQLNKSDISQVISSYSDGSNFLSSPAVAGNYIYIGSTKGFLYQLNASDISQVIHSYDSGNNIECSPAVADGYVYFGNNRGDVYQLDASDVRNLIAVYSTGSSVRSSPAVANGYVYIGSNDNHLYQLNASDISQKIADYNTGNSVWASPAVTEDYVYIGSLSDKVFQLNASNVSKEIANIPTSANVYSSAAVGNGFVYVASKGNKIVYKLNASDITQIKATYQAGSDILSSPALAGGIVYIGSNDNKLYALNATDLSFISSYTTSDNVKSSPAVAGGVVFVANNKGDLYKFGEEVVICDNNNVCDSFETTENCPNDCQCDLDTDCADGNVCTDDSCAENRCLYTPNDILCDDGDAGTINDVCSAGVCVGEPICNNNGICEAGRGETEANCIEDCGTFVSVCIVLDKPNTEYTITADIIPPGPGDCIVIAAENITLDCMGYSISNTNLAAAGIYSNQYNTTIKNCNVSMKKDIGGYGIHLAGSNNSYIFNNILNINFIGLYIEAGFNNIIEDNRLEYNNITAGGSGTAADPYRITNCKDLQAIDTLPLYPNGYYVLVNDIDCSETLDWSWPSRGGKGFRPIGFEPYEVGKPFRGHFDGNYHLIKNLYIGGGSYKYLGLFSHVGDIGCTAGVNCGEIKNVGLVDVYVKGTNYIGGLVGGFSGDKGTITNSFVTGEVNGNVYAGLLVGSNWGSITNCYGTGKVSAPLTNSYDIGGLIGGNYGPVINCYANVEVSGYDFVGGLIGDNENTITYQNMVYNSYSVGSVTGWANWRLGGLIGYTNPDWVITNNYWYKFGGWNVWKCIPYTNSGCSEVSDIAQLYNKGHGVYTSVTPTWDFNNVWQEHADNFPTLRGFDKPQGGSGIYIESSSGNILINNKADSNLNYGVYLKDSIGNEIDNNNLSSNYNGILLDSGSSSNQVRDNQASLNRIQGLLIESDANDIIGNTVNSNNFHGIYLLEGAQNNNIKSNTASSNSRNGIYLESSSGNNVINNTVNSNSKSGIYLESSFGNNIINNTVNSNMGGPSSGGIYLSFSSNNNIIGNDVNANNEKGIYVGSGSYNVIQDNSINSNVDGIYIQGTYSNPIPIRNEIVGNRLDMNSYGITLSYSNYTTLTNNYISNCVGTLSYRGGIFLQSSNNNVISGGIIGPSSSNGISLYPDESGGSNNNLFKDIILAGTVRNDLYVTGASINNTFLNATYLQSEEYVEAGSELIREWYYKAYVKNTANNPFVGATVDIQNALANPVNTLTTDANGEIETQEFVDYIYDGVARTYYSPHTVEASHPLASTETHIIVGGGNLIDDVFTLTDPTAVVDCDTLRIPNAVYTLQNDISSSGTCFIIEANNVTLDFNGHRITGDISGSGVYVNGYNYSTIKNGEIYNFEDGIWIESNFNTIENMTVNSNSNQGILIAEGTTSNLLKNIIVNENAQAGIWLEPNSGSNTLEGITANSNDNYGIFLGSSSDNLVRDSTINSNLNGDVYLLPFSENNIFLNVTYEEESVDTDSQLIRKWYYQAHVADPLGTDFPGAEIKIYNSSDALVDTLTTDVGGETDKIGLIDYINDGTTVTYYGPYTTETSNQFYQTEVHNIDITTLTNVYDEFTLSLQPRVGIELISPIESAVNATQNEFFDVQVEVTCYHANCDEVDVSLDPIVGDSGSTTLCDLDWGTPENGDMCGVSGDESTSYWFDFDSLTKVPAYDVSADLSKGHGPAEDPNGCCNWFVQNGTTQVLTNSLIGDFDSVVCSPADGRIYSDASLNYCLEAGEWCDGLSEKYVACLKTANDVYVKYKGQTDCCGDIVIDWEVTHTPGKGLISTTIRDTPFYTIDANPARITLNQDESQIITFRVNATGEIDSSYEFFAFANLVSDPTVREETDRWKVTIVEPPPIVIDLKPQIKTLKDEYYLDEFVNLTDPPAAGTIEDYTYIGTYDSTIYSYDEMQLAQIINPQESISSFEFFNGKLYGTTYNGVYVYDASSWSYMANSPQYVGDLDVYNGKLYASSYDGIYVYDGVWSLVISAEDLALAVGHTGSMSIRQLEVYDDELYVTADYYGLFAYNEVNWRGIPYPPEVGDYMYVDYPYAFQGKLYVSLYSTLASYDKINGWDLIVYGYGLDPKVYHMGPKSCYGDRLFVSTSNGMYAYDGQNFVEINDGITYPEEARINNYNGNLYAILYDSDSGNYKLYMYNEGTNSWGVAPTGGITSFYYPVAFGPEGYCGEDCVDADEDMIEACDENGNAILGCDDPCDCNDADANKWVKIPQLAVDNDYDGYRVLPEAEECVGKKEFRAFQIKQRDYYNDPLLENVQKIGDGDCDDDPTDDPGRCPVDPLLVDCNDPAMSVCASCIHEGAEEVCNDGKDNDCDGDVDCEDSDCIGGTQPGILYVAGHKDGLTAADFVQTFDGMAVADIDSNSALDMIHNLGYDPVTYPDSSTYISALGRYKNKLFAVFDPGGFGTVSVGAFHDGQSWSYAGYNRNSGGGFPGINFPQRTVEYNDIFYFIDGDSLYSSSGNEPLKKITDFSGTYLTAITAFKGKIYIADVSGQGYIYAYNPNTQNTETAYAGAGTIVGMDVLGDSIYAASSDDYIINSNDGTSWEVSSLPADSLHSSISHIASFNDKIYAFTDYSPPYEVICYYSGDEGATWSQLDQVSVKSGSDLNTYVEDVEVANNRLYITAGNFDGLYYIDTSNNFKKLPSSGTWPRTIPILLESKPPQRTTCGSGSCTVPSNVAGYNPSFCTPEVIAANCGDLGLSITAESHYLLDRNAVSTNSLGDLRISMGVTGEAINKGGDVVFVLDSSGSMTGQKIEDAKTALKGVVDRFLNGADADDYSYGAVGFREYSYLVSPLTTYDPADPTSINLKDRLNNLEANGRTSCGDGLCMASNMVQNHQCIESETDFIIVSSDGMENEPAWLYEVLPKISSTTTVFSIGVGHDFTEFWEEKLKEMAKSGSGRGIYYHVPSTSDLDRIYNQITDEILEFVPPHIATVTLTLGPDVTFIESDPAPIAINGNQLTYSLNLKATESNNIDMKYTINQAGPAQTIINDAHLSVDTGDVCGVIDQDTGAVIVDVVDDQIDVSLTNRYEKQWPENALEGDVTFYADLTYTDAAHQNAHYPDAGCIITFDDIPGRYDMPEGQTSYNFTRWINLTDKDSVYYTITCTHGSYVWAIKGSIWMKNTPEEDQSKITNNAANDIDVCLLMKVQYFNETLEEWIDEANIVDDSLTAPRTIKAGSYIALDKIWNPTHPPGGWNTSTNTYGEGTYRAYVIVRDNNCVPLVNGSGDSIEAYYNFTLVMCDNDGICDPGETNENCPNDCQCELDIGCDDGLYCNGQETCVGNRCQAGVAPPIDDGVGCTIDNCDEATDTITHTEDDSLCLDGLWCNGDESCDALLDCQTGTAPNCDDSIECTIDSCDEDNDKCVVDDSPCNVPPTQDTPILNSTYGTNFTYENLTCYNVSTYDSNGDNVINSYKWYKDTLEQPQLENLQTITSGNISLFDLWQCSITPFDGILSGETKFSNNLTITCLDSDGDGICDENDLCPDENQAICQDPEECISWIFNTTTGCCQSVFNDTTDVIGEYECPDTECLDYLNVSITCDGQGSTTTQECANYQFKPVGSSCGTGYNEYSCAWGHALDTNTSVRLISFTCNAQGSCVKVIGNWQVDEDCESYEYCYGNGNSTNDNDYYCTCDDLDDDGICDTVDSCPDEGPISYPDDCDNNECCWYEMDPRGCWSKINQTEGYVVDTIDCDVLDATCIDYFDVNSTCDGYGNVIVGVCNVFVEDPACFDPDESVPLCEGFIPGNQEECDYAGETACWDPYTPIDPTHDTSCCGDDNETGDEECWTDSLGNGCAYSSEYNAVVYLTDPDKSPCLCEGLAPGMQGQCDVHNEQFCWSTHAYIEGTGSCCGDDIGETWNYSTSYYLEDILVNGTCYKGKWYVRQQGGVTYYDIWSRVLSAIFG